MTDKPVTLIPHAHCRYDWHGHGHGGYMDTCTKHCEPELDSHSEECTFDFASRVAGEVATKLDEQSRFAALVAGDASNIDEIEAGMAEYQREGM